ncbi:hypothetical protein EV714DRAFT_204932 [Schizophyllum commune]
MTQQPNSAEPSKELKAIYDSIGKLQITEVDRHNSPRVRSLFKRLDGILRRERPFAAFENGPPMRRHGDRRMLSLTDPQIAHALTALRTFVMISGHIGAFKLPLTPEVGRVSQQLFQYIPVALDWMEMLHPMNDHLQPASGAHGYQELSRILAGMLRAVCTPNLYGGREEMYEYIFTTPVMSYLADLWINLFRYTADPTLDTVAMLVQLMYGFAKEIHPKFESSRVARELILSTVRQRIRKKTRRLCHAISHYGVHLEGSTEPHCKIVSAQLFALGSLFATDPEVLDNVCPREDIRTLVRLMDVHVGRRNWLTVSLGANYLASFWRLALDNRAFEWAINDGVIGTFLNAFTLCDDYAALEDLQRVGDILPRHFNSWRVLHAFHENTTDLLPKLRRASSHHPVIADWMIAYDERIIALDRARDSYKRRRERCMYSECSQSLTEPGIKALACEGKDAWYCSAQCQRADWKERHRHICRSGVVPTVSQRDLSFMGMLAVLHVDYHRHSVLKEVLSADPNRCRRIALHVDLRQPRITHKVKVLGEKPPGDPWKAKLFVCWHEWKDSTHYFGEIFDLDAMLKEVEKETAVASVADSTA